LIACWTECLVFFPSVPQYAAQEILDSVSNNLFSMTMCPLDITTPHTIPFSQLIHDSTRTDPSTPLKEFTTAMLIRVRGLMKSFGLPDGMEMHDPLAIWYTLACLTTKGETGGGEAVEWKTEKRVFKVERKGEFTRGMCVVDRRCVFVCPGFNRWRFDNEN
jgi:inosine-uridine nucleoside N-ribohydrolase